MELVTERLVLREMITEDWRWLYEIERQPDVVRYMTQGVATEDSMQTYVDGIFMAAQVEPRMVYDLAIIARDGGQFLGRCGMKRKDHEPRISDLWYVLHPDRVGQGYATEAARALVAFAFDELGMHRMCADIDPRNAPSARVLERLGMRREAHFVKDVWIKGEWCDTMIYAILRDEWAARGAR